MMTPKAAPSFRPQRRRNTLSLLCPTGAGCEGDGLREGPDSPYVIASEAKQSILSSCGEMDCFASLAMTFVADITPPSRGGIAPEVLL
jgi:hypothetical protein